MQIEYTVTEASKIELNYKKVRKAKFDTLNQMTIFTRFSEVSSY